MPDARLLLYRPSMRHCKKRWRRDERVFIMGEDIGPYGGLSRSRAI